MPFTVLILCIPKKELPYGGRLEPTVLQGLGEEAASVVENATRLGRLMSLTTISTTLNL